MIPGISEPGNGHDYVPGILRTNADIIPPPNFQIRNLRDEEFMLLFLIVKSGEPYDFKPVFFFGKMVTAVG